MSIRRYFHADERGSVIAVTDSGGALVATRNRYDEYGVPQGTLTGRFGYTGQAWLPEIGMAYYRARIYNPALGRFMQADPIGYGSGMNLYAYVLNDPVNLVDLSGMSPVVEPWGPDCTEQCGDILVIGTLLLDIYSSSVVGSPVTTNERGGNAGGENQPFCDEPGVDPSNCAPVVTGRRNPPRPPRPQQDPFRSPLLTQLASLRGVDRCGGGDQTWPPDRVFGVDISSACETHDACYSSIIDRITCDQVFYHHIRIECRRQSGGLGCYAAAAAYFIAVRRAGRRFYRGSGNRD